MAARKQSPEAKQVKGPPETIVVDLTPWVRRPTDRDEALEMFAEAVGVWQSMCLIAQPREDDIQLAYAVRGALIAHARARKDKKGLTPFVSAARDVIAKRNPIDPAAMESEAVTREELDDLWQRGAPDRFASRMQREAFGWREYDEAKQLATTLKGNFRLAGGPRRDQLAKVFVLELLTRAPRLRALCPMMRDCITHDGIGAKRVGEARRDAIETVAMSFADERLTIPGGAPSLNDLKAAKSFVREGLKALGAKDLKKNLFSALDQELRRKGPHKRSG